MPTKLYTDVSATECLRQCILILIFNLNYNSTALIRHKVTLSFDRDKVASKLSATFSRIKAVLL